MDGMFMEDIIRLRAYFLWEKEGRPQGKAEDHWARAESEISGHDKRDDETLSSTEKLLAGRPWRSKGRGSVQGSGRN